MLSHRHQHVLRLAHTGQRTSIPTDLEYEMPFLAAIVGEMRADGDAAAMLPAAYELLRDAILGIEGMSKLREANVA